MRYLIILLISILLLTLGFWGGLFAKETVFKSSMVNIFTSKTNTNNLDLSAYYIDNLRNHKSDTGNLEILELTQDENDFNSYLFRFTFNPNPTDHIDKSTTGVINIPKNTDKPPLILMMRGYVDQDYYLSGMGTRRSSEYFASNGYITIAPDYLGYAGSSEESENIFETRFQTYTTTLALLKTIEELKSKKELLSGSLDEYIEKLTTYKNLFIWAHSNGGQIALTTLAITEQDIPTVLWAPVTKPFPYSVLYYTDESDDGGKFIRSELSKLEKDNDANKFSFTNYLDSINAPILIIQGTKDNAVPFGWSQTIVNNLNKSFKEREMDTEADLLIKNGADHNLIPEWEESLLDTLDFYNIFLD